MAYCSYNDIAALIPPDFLVQALDDNGDGAADDGLFDTIEGLAEDDINAFLGVRYALPLDQPYPPVVVSAARALTCEKLYDRRGIGPDKNPWTAKANAARAVLKAISLGETPLAPDLNRADPSASIVTEPMITASHRGRTMLA